MPFSSLWLSPDGFRSDVLIWDLGKELQFLFGDDPNLDTDLSKLEMH